MSLNTLYDPDRLLALNQTGLLNNQIEKAFDRLTELSRRLLKTPTAIFTLIDDSKVFFKSAAGMNLEELEDRAVPIEVSFCQHVIVSGDPIIISNAPEDDQVKDSSAIIDMSLISYLGVPIKLNGKHVIGTLCVIDSKPRNWEQDDLDTINELAESLMTEIRMKLALEGQKSTIAEKNKLIEEIDKDRAIFDALFDQMQAAILLLDPETGKPLLINKASYDLIYKVDCFQGSLESFGQHEGYRLGKKIAPHEWPAARTLFNGETVTNEEIDYFSADEKWVTLLVNSSMVKDSTGKKIGVIFTANDITQKKQAELQKEAAQKKLAQMSERKDQFLAVLAHELRNPLAVIASGIDILTIDRVNEGNRDDRTIVSAMQSQIDHLTRLIDDLLDTARIQSGKIKVELSPIRLSDAIDEAILSCKHLVENRAHTLIKNLDRLDDVYVDADTQRLCQVFSNLIGNAAKYTPVNGQIEVYCHIADGQVSTSIKDNGVGIPIDTQQNVFDFYSQLDENKDDNYKGLGIGLHLANEIMQLLKGSINVTSKGLGKGSIFTVTMPLSKNIEKHKTSISIKKAQKNDLQVVPLNILVVDDSIHIGRFLKIMLESLNQNCRFCEGAQEALGVLEEWKPDLILSDLAMPEMSGYEFAQRVKSSLTLQSIPMVALSGFSQEKEKAKALDAGFEAHLVKPLRAPDLQQLVEKYQATTYH